MNTSPADDQIKTIRQERSRILADLAHLDTDAALFVLISALDERALEKYQVIKVKFLPLGTVKMDKGAA